MPSWQVEQPLFKVEWFAGITGKACALVATSASMTRSIHITAIQEEGVRFLSPLA